MRRSTLSATAVAVLTLTLLIWSPARAQVNNYLMAWGAVGYSSFIHNVPYTTPLGGGGGLLGFGYELNYKKFIMNFGAEFDFKNSTTLRNKFQMDVDMHDTEGEEFVFTYHVTKFRDHYNVGYVNVPLCFGARGQRFYFLAGAKVGFNLFAFASTRANIHTTGTYPWSIVPFENMPDHFWTDKKLATTGQKFNMNMNVVGTAEFGWNFYPAKKKAKHYYRIGIFADYGVLNVHINDDRGNVVGIPPAGKNPLDLQLNSLFTSNQCIDKDVNPLLVGVKFTILLQVGEHHPCNCYQPYRTRWAKQNNRIYSTSSKKSIQQHDSKWKRKNHKKGK